jgi:hypothetical protein
VKNEVTAQIGGAFQVKSILPHPTPIDTPVQVEMVLVPDSQNAIRSETATSRAQTVKTGDRLRFKFNTKTADLTYTKGWLSYDGHLKLRLDFYGFPC